MSTEEKAFGPPRPEKELEHDKLRAAQAWLKKRITELLVDTEGFDPDENLIYYGLDSIRAMQIASELKSRGIHISLADMADKPSLNRWQQLIQEKLQAE